MKSSTKKGLPFGSKVTLQRGGHKSPKPGQFRNVKAIYIGAKGQQVLCRLEQNDPDACYNYCTKKGDTGWWGRSQIKISCPKLPKKNSS